MKRYTFQLILRNRFPLLASRNRETQAGHEVAVLAETELAARRFMLEEVWGYNLLVSSIQCIKQEQA